MHKSKLLSPNHLDFNILIFFFILFFIIKNKNRRDERSLRNSVWRPQGVILKEIKNYKINIRG